MEEQLLARVVQLEQPELESQKQELQQAFNRYQIQLVQLEDDLLESLANAPDDILSDVPLIEGLEATKVCAFFKLALPPRTRKCAHVLILCARILSTLTNHLSCLFGASVYFPSFVIANCNGYRRSC